MASFGSCAAKRLYQLKIHLLGVSPMVWRRVLVSEESSLAELHGVLQITMGWENQHLHCFRIFGKHYGISYAGGMEFQNDARKVVLSDLGLQRKDTFFYDYDFYADWQHHIRVEKILEVEAGSYYPRCIAGENACPPENISDIEIFHKIRELYAIPLYNLLKIIRFQEDVGYAWRPDTFKRKVINSLLRNTDYRCLGQSDPFFPDRSSPYFQDAYWRKEDDLQALISIYHLLQKTGVEISDEPDGFFEEPTGWHVLQAMLEKLSEVEQKKPTDQGEVPVVPPIGGAIADAIASVDEIRQNS